MTGETMSNNPTEEFDRLYDILQTRGFHEDGIDELTIEQMRRLDSSGLSVSDETGKRRLIKNGQ